MSRYIDADKLKSEFDFKHIDMNKTAAFVHHCNILEIIDKQPTADVRENVRGEWIEDNSRAKSMMWRCSVCGQIAYYPIIGQRKSYKKHCGYNFCPNCGADMRGDKT